MGVEEQVQGGVLQGQAVPNGDGAVEGTGRAETVVALTAP